MFSVFASKDRRANYELLLFIYDTFTQDECMQAVQSIPLRAENIA